VRVVSGFEDGHGKEQKRIAYRDEAREEVSALLSPVSADAEAVERDDLREEEAW
jgi:hypothetical protein